MKIKYFEMQLQPNFVQCNTYLLAMSYVITKVVLSEYDSQYIFETVVLCKSISYFKEHE